MSPQPIDPASYAAIPRLGRSALAWEVLRRDPAYLADFRSWQSRGGQCIMNRTFIARWGLHFP